MYQYPQFEVNDEIYKQVKSAFQSVNRIAGALEERQNNLQGMRKTIENDLLQDSREFHTEMNELKASIESFKEKSSQKQYVEFNQNIDSLKTKLDLMTQKMQTMNKKQEHLGFDIEQFPILEQCKKNIKPYEDFWKAFAELEKCNQEWLQTPVNELDADEIQS